MVFGSVTSVVLAIHIVLVAGAQVASGSAPTARHIAHIPRVAEPTATITSAPAADSCSTIQSNVFTNSPRFPSDFASWYTTVFESMPPCATVTVPSSLVSLAAWWQCAGQDWYSSHRSLLSSFSSQCSSWISSSEADFSATKTCFRYFQFDGGDPLACTSWLTQVTNTAPAPIASSTSSGSPVINSTIGVTSSSTGAGSAAGSATTKSTPSSAAGGWGDYLAVRETGLVVIPAVLLSFIFL